MNDDHDNQQQLQTPAELQAIESQLSLLEPRADRLDRERLIFLAGQASVELPTARWAWPASLAAMTALAATLLAMLITPSDVVPPKLPTTEKSLAAIRQDFAQQSPRRQRPRGITTATLFREKELAELLNVEELFVTNHEAASSTFSEESLRHTILTPNSWNQLIEDRSL